MINGLVWTGIAWPILDFCSIQVTKVAIQDRAYESGHSGGGLPAGFSGLRLRGGKKNRNPGRSHEILGKNHGKIMEIPIMNPFLSVNSPPYPMV